MTTNIADSLVIPTVATPATEAATPAAGPTARAVLSHAVADALKAQRYGVELECVGRSRETIAKAIARALKVPASSVTKGTDYYKSFFVTAADGRRWRVMADNSLTGACRGSTPSWESLSGEIVTPILTHADRDTLRAVVRAVKRCGATVDDTCGMHVHVGADDLTVGAVARLATDIENYERFFDMVLCRKASRRTAYAKPLPASLNAKLRAIAAQAQTGLESAVSSATLRSAWYDALPDTQAHGTSEHYHGSRYHGLNLHALFTKGTVEIRLFDGTLEEDEVMTNLDVALSCVARARVETRIKPGAGFANVAMWALYPDTADMFGARYFYERHGLVGAEFAETRARLTARVRAAQPAR